MCVREAAMRICAHRTDSVHAAIATEGIAIAGIAPELGPAPRRTTVAWSAVNTELAEARRTLRTCARRRRTAHRTVHPVGSDRIRNRAGAGPQARAQGTQERRRPAPAVAGRDSARRQGARDPAGRGDRGGRGRTARTVGDPPRGGMGAARAQSRMVRRTAHAPDRDTALRRPPRRRRTRLKGPRGRRRSTRAREAIVRLDAMADTGASMPAMPWGALRGTRTERIERMERDARTLARALTRAGVLAQARRTHARGRDRACEATHRTRRAPGSGESGSTCPPQQRRGARPSTPRSLGA